jgi:hypothetical protein
MHRKFPSKVPFLKNGTFSVYGTAVIVRLISKHCATGRSLEEGSSDEQQAVEILSRAFNPFQLLCD